MTLEMAQIIQKFHLPVVIVSGINTESIRNKEFRIKEITVSYSNFYKDWICSVTLEQDQRAVYRVNLSDIEQVKGYENMIASKLKMDRKNKLKAAVKIAYEDLKTKKAVNKLVSELIDEVKNEK